MIALSRLPAAVLLLFAALALAQPPGGRKGSFKAPPDPRSADLDRFRALDPAERLRVAGETAGPRLAFAAVARGDLTVTVVERGTLEPTRTADVACRVKARVKDQAAATIKWLIDDGTPVKKGDKLAELDDADLRDQHRAIKVKVAEVEATLAGAAESARLSRREAEIEVRLAEVGVELAAAELKDPPPGQKKAVLDLKVERAKLLLERAKTQAHARVVQAEADVKARAAVREQVVERLRAVEAELHHCVAHAPMDGLAVYPAPAAGRFGGPPPVAIGETVREGQTLLRVIDISQVAVVTRVHEAHISTVREGQPAEVRVDAFPGRVVRGKVAKVATVASQSDWMANDVKVYPVAVALDDPPPGLKPGMTAEVRIVTAEKKGVLHVPVQAVLGSGRDRFCFVRVGEGLHERKITTGANSATAVEVTDGLKEGDDVLTNPLAALPRPAPAGKGRGGRPPQAKEAGDGTVVVARSVRPPDDAGRSFVQSYGLTHADLARFAGLPAVTDAAPLRIFPATAARRERTEQIVLVATTPDLAAFHRVEPAAGRLLTADDDRQMSNVAVLGKATGADLFPDADPVGQTIALGGHAFQVVGVLGDQPAVASGVLTDPDRAVYVPLRTCQARFGDRVVIRTGGSRRMEAVPLHAVLLRVRSAADAGPTAEAVRAILTADHAQKDWQVEVPPAGR